MPRRRSRGDCVSAMTESQRLSARRAAEPHSVPSAKYQARSTKLETQSTKLETQSTKHKPQSTKHKVQSTKSKSPYDILLPAIRHYSRRDASLSAFAEVNSERDESLSRNRNCLCDGNCCLRNSRLQLLVRQIVCQFTEDIQLGRSRNGCWRSCN